MADDELDDDFTPDVIEEELDEAVLDEEDLGVAALEDDDEVLAVDVDLDDDEEDDSVEAKAARAKKKSDEEDDDEDEVDPDDVEADLDTILKDRIAAVEEEEDDDEDEIEAPRAAPETPDGVIPKRANEFTCPGCFLLVNRDQFGPASDMRCPVGESDCPAIGILDRPVAPPRKLAPKAGKPTRKAAKVAKKR